MAKTFSNSIQIEEKLVIKLDLSRQNNLKGKIFGLKCRFSKNGDKTKFFIGPTFEITLAY